MSTPASWRSLGLLPPEDRVPQPVIQARPPARGSEAGRQAAPTPRRKGKGGSTLKPLGSRHFRVKSSFQEVQVVELIFIFCWAWQMQTKRLPCSVARALQGRSFSPTHWRKVGMSEPSCARHQK